MSPLTYLGIGSVVFLGAFAGWYKIQNLSLENSLLEVTQSRDEWMEAKTEADKVIIDIGERAKVANNKNNAYIKDLKEGQKKFIELQEELSHANEKTEKLLKLFGEHDFEYLLRSSPKAMQRIIRVGTKRVFRRFIQERLTPTIDNSGDNREREGRG